MAEHYASGTWHVKQGKEGEFIERWTEFLGWTRKEHPTMESARLIQDQDDRAHFVSLAEWESAEARAAWKRSPGSMPRLAACRELCDEFHGSDYELVASV